MTDLEKQIYNKHLAVSRFLRNKPFKVRTKFDGFEKDARYVFIKRLETFFTKFPEIDMDLYFKAPYQLYKDVRYFDLNYFASPRGIKAYTTYKQQMDEVSPDRKVNEVKASLSFIAKFCMANKISLEKYIRHQSDGMHPEWIYQLKRNEISFYSLMEFPNLYDCMMEMAADERDLFLGKYSTDFQNYKHKYMSTKNLRPFLKLAFPKIKTFIDNSLLKS